MPVPSAVNPWLAQRIREMLRLDVPMSIPQPGDAPQAPGRARTPWFDQDAPSDLFPRPRNPDLNADEFSRPNPYARPIEDFDIDDAIRATEDRLQSAGRMAHEVPDNEFWWADVRDEVLGPDRSQGRHVHPFELEADEALSPMGYADDRLPTEDLSGIDRRMSQMSDLERDLVDGVTDDVLSFKRAPDAAEAAAKKAAKKSMMKGVLRKGAKLAGPLSMLLAWPEVSQAAETYGETGSGSGLGLDLALTGIGLPQMPEWEQASKKYRNVGGIQPPRPRD